MSPVGFQRHEAVALGAWRVIPRWLTRGSEQRLSMEQGRDAAGAEEVLVLCLTGKAETERTLLQPGSVTLLRTSERIRSLDRCALVLLSGIFTGGVEAAHVELRGIDRYQKYKAKVGRVRLSLSGDRDGLYPWSLYHVRMEHRPTECDLHTHHDLNNFVFIQGSGTSPVAELIVQDDGKTASWPLKPGDSALVRPNIHHTIVPVSSEPFEMFVLNDSQSNYEDEQHSDFHLTQNVRWDQVRANPSLPEGVGLMDVRRDLSKE